MDDEEYVATLLAILTNPAPSGIDPADPYGQADDGIDRLDGFGRDVKVAGLRLVDGPHCDELEVSFTLELPTGDSAWRGVPARGLVRVPFDGEWRRLSGFTDPAAYAPQVAAGVMSGVQDHAAQYQHAGRRARARAEWRSRARAGLPDRETQWQLLLRTLAGEGEATQVAPDRFELRLRDDPTGDGADSAEGLEDAAALDTVPDGFVVFYQGGPHRSTRAQLPRVRGRDRERAWARLRAKHPLGPGDGWYAFNPNDPHRREDPGPQPPTQ